MMSLVQAQQGEPYWGNNFAPYFCTAMDIQYGGSHIDLYELTLDEIIDFDAFRVICNSVAICLYGMDAVKVAEKRKKYKKKKKGKVKADARS